MKTKICDMLGCEFPLFAFSHCRDVIAEVSKAGGFGVLGAVGHTPESLEVELNWIDEQVGDKPYGVDLIVPTSIADKAGSMSPQDLLDRVPDAHRRHVENILAEHGIDTAGSPGMRGFQKAMVTTCANPAPARSWRWRSITRSRP